MRSIVLFLILIIGCRSSVQKKEPMPISFEDFEASFDNCCTTEIEHYEFGLDWWKAPYYYDTASHFPDTLYMGNSYEYFFVPPILQGPSQIALKIDFGSSGAANMFFQESTVREVAQQFSKFSELEQSSFCYPSEFGFNSGYSLNNNCEIALFTEPKCSGKFHGKVSKGIESGIAFDRSANAIICWARDRRN
jgi:hypothetical protein